MGFQAGLIALIGKPNVGKSTLMNALVGQKVSIVSNRPQTTRRRVIGILQGEQYQIGFVDTPGIHEPHTRLGQAMVQQARAALGDVDAILVVVDGSKRPDDLEKEIAKLVQMKEVEEKPVLLCLNKMDILKPEHVIPHVEAYTALFRTDRYMLTAASRGHNLDKLLRLLLDVLPESEPLFPEDEFTDQSARFMVAELIRERILVGTRQEVPYAAAVRVDTWEDGEDDILRIGASLVVEKEGQKAILIGKHGAMIKSVGMAAREEVEDLLGRKVHLELHVVVKEDWRMNPRLLKELDYTE